jgi:hypothetical protein
MKIILVLCIVLFCSTVAVAGPWLVCDPQPGVTHYRLLGPAWVPGEVPAEGDGSIRFDVGSAPVGKTELTVSACKADGLWGELCASAPFDFERPSGPSVTGLKLVK